LKREDMLLRLR